MESVRKKISKGNNHMMKIPRVECGCKQWKKNIPILDSVIMNAWIHSLPYSGEVFKYCPWCSGRLRQIREDEIDGYQKERD